MFEIVNGHTHTHTHTDTRTPARVLSYKLTLWAFSSGELKIWRQHDVGICPGSAVFKTHAVNGPFPRGFSHRKYRFTGSFSSKSSSFHFDAIIAIKHDFLMHLHLPGPSGRVNQNPRSSTFLRDRANVNAWKTMFNPCIRRSNYWDESMKLPKYVQMLHNKRFTPSGLQVLRYDEGHYTFDI